MILLGLTIAAAVLLYAVYRTESRGPATFERPRGQRRLGLDFYPQRNRPGDASNAPGPETRS